MCHNVKYMGADTSSNDVSDETQILLHVYAHHKLRCNDQVKHKQFKSTTMLF